VTTCFICDDPRQFTPPTGQAFTNLDVLRSSRYKNVFTPIPADPERLISIHTEPKVAIGQRAILVRTPQGNTLWDCITLIDDETIARIKEVGGLKAIVISHPHYYSTHLEWARAFGCQVFLSPEDKEWIAQPDERIQVMIDDESTDIEIFGTRVLRLGGHFPGLMVLLFDGRLLIADTIVTTPSGLGSWDTDAVGTARRRPEGMNSFVFMWSIPNMVPLAPDVIQRMWEMLKPLEFSSTHGAFTGVDIVRTPREMKQRVLESMQMQIRYSGYGNHAMLEETII
jgi:hypothetical protein